MNVFIPNDEPSLAVNEKWLRWVFLCNGFVNGLYFWYSLFRSLWWKTPFPDWSRQNQTKQKRLFLFTDINTGTCEISAVPLPGWAAQKHALNDDHKRLQRRFSGLHSLVGGKLCCLLHGCPIHSLSLKNCSRPSTLHLLCILIKFPFLAIIN